MEWHPNKVARGIRVSDFNKETNNLKDGVIWSADWDFANFKNILFCIDEVRKNHKELMDRMDQIISDNKELRERCSTLENEVRILKR